jgi:hypothetical protein
MKPKRICAYCGKEGKSKEHIFPSWLIKKTPEYELKFSKIKGQVSPNENVVHDVCEECNNGPLSQLDESCRVLYDSQLSQIVRGPVKIEYDFTKLTRWLLKVAFNSARKNKADLSSFTSLIPYMLGKDLGLPDRVVFLVEVVKPYEGDWGGEHVVMEPHDHRIGNMRFKSKPSFLFIREGRFVAIDSFYFYILFLHLPIDDNIFQTIKADFPGECVRLTPAKEAVEIAPVRNYLEVKLPEIGMNQDAYLKAYRKYMRPKEKAHEETK